MAWEAAGPLLALGGRLALDALDAALQVGPPPCPPCNGGDVVLCTLRYVVSIARGLVWGAPC